MAASDATTVYCLVFDHCGFPVRPVNYVYFFDVLGPKYAIKTVSVQATKTIKDTKFQNRFAPSAREAVEYEADLLLADLQDLAEINIICIPGGELGAPRLASSQSLGVALRPIIDKARWIITEGLGSTVLAAAGLLDGRRALVTLAGLAGAKQDYPTVDWGTDRFFRPMGKILHEQKFIMSDNLGRPAPAYESAAARLNANFFKSVVERGENLIEAIPPPPTLSRGAEGPQYTAITDAQVADLTNSIKTEREDPQLIRIAEDFAIRLASEGYVEDCNVIVTELLNHQSDALNPLIKRGLEMIWHTAGPRPETPYPQPTDAELASMEEEQRYHDLRERSMVSISNFSEVPFAQLAPDQVGVLATAFAAVQHREKRKLIKRVELGGGASATSYDEGPISMPTEDEERRGLGAFRNYMSRRDEDDSPLNIKLLIVYSNLALKYGLEEEGKRWLELCLQEALKTTSSWLTLASLANGRYTSVELGKGALQRLTGTTQAVAHRAAQEIAAALRDRWQAGEQRPFASLSWPELLQRIQDGQVETREAHDGRYLRQPAPEQAIAAAEARLGVTLPSDYKAFLRTTSAVFNAAPEHSEGLRSTGAT
ncbi:hypothetical protein CALCODRAFT_555897 [Calocera cornea HHB12733]|uniref:Uncharacterized protein n=1 Tax=Calocera cornea HHB12733 TaxID=1353952 RepID=A0A165F9T7_9BASI|nr:hypothetical protein CALCODRAFT_555897 [Calocera cornea HHB12733]